MGAERSQMDSRARTLPTKDQPFSLSKGSMMGPEMTSTFNLESRLSGKYMVRSQAQGPAGKPA